MVKRILACSRYLIIIAVLGTFLTSILVLVYGGITVGGVAFETFVHGTFMPDSAKHLEIECIEIIDLFLLGSVLYIGEAQLQFLLHRYQWTIEGRSMHLRFLSGYYRRSGFDITGSR